MTLERKKRLLELIDQALEQDPEDRARFLDEVCSDDPELRNEVESLIETEADSEFLEEPVFSVHAEDPGIGRHIGHYQLVRLLDRGGMGTVYLAQREDFEQRVALKLIRRGLDVDEMFVRRFENERQILARLDHPHIARLLDGGTTEDQVPYFVMEYIEGEPIDRYCDARGLSVDQRLELFRKVCSAVQFAHQNLVVHRDLKPGNILITADGQPKLLDFGIAKLLDEDLAAQTLDTLPGQGPLTPRYASPEQIRMEPITTASDVYSLGVLLYELLTGLDPYHLDTDRSDLVARAICEQEPDRPSTAVRRRAAEIGADETATDRKGRPTIPSDPRKLQRRLSGDLDSIVLKAMRKEPEARYSSVERFSEDIGRHLEGKAVAARPGTVSYRAGKFLRRHRVKSAAATVFLILSLSLGFVTRQAALDRQRAEYERQGTQLATQFLSDLFQKAAPDETGGEELTALELMERSTERIAEIKDFPKIRLSLAGDLGRIFRRLGGYEESKKMMEVALEAARELYGDDHPEVAKRISNLGAVLISLKDYSMAERCFRDALEIRLGQGQEGSDLHKTKNNLASSLILQNEFERAEELYLQVLKSRIEINKIDDQEVTAENIAYSHRNLAALYYAWGKLEKSDQHIRIALSIHREAYGASHTLVGSALDLLASVSASRGRRDEAKEQFVEALRIRHSLLLSGDHENLARTRANYAAFLARENPQAALSYIKLALETFNLKQSKTWLVADAQSVLGEVLVELRRYDEAGPLLLAGHAELADARGDSNFRTVLALKRIIRLYAQWDKPEEIPQYRALIEAAGPAGDRRLPSMMGDE